MKSLLALLPCLMFVAAPLTATPDDLPKQATAEELVTLRNALQNRTALIHRLMPNVQGGPGFTQETAWMMLNTKPSVVRQEYDVLRMLPSVKHLAQALISCNGRRYDRHTIIALMPEERLVMAEVWFDITDYFAALREELHDSETEPVLPATEHNQTEREVKAIIAKHLGTAAENLNGDAKLIEDLGADPIDLVEIVIDIDEQLGVSMSDELIESLETVNDIVTYVCEHQE